MTQLGSIYSWASPEYMLNKMTLAQLFYYYELGMAFEKERVKFQSILTGAASNGVFPEDDVPDTKKEDQTPDRAGLKARFGAK